MNAKKNEVIELVFTCTACDAREICDESEELCFDCNALLLDSIEGWEAQEAEWAATVDREWMEVGNWEASNWDE